MAALIMSIYFNEMLFYFFNIFKVMRVVLIATCLHIRFDPVHDIQHQDQKIKELNQDMFTLELMFVHPPYTEDQEQKSKR